MYVLVVAAVRKEKKRKDKKNRPVELLITSGKALKSPGAYHLYGKLGNSGENSNETVHRGGNFSDKRKYLPRYYVFPAYTEIFCAICADYQCHASFRGKVKNLPVFCK